MYPELTELHIEYVADKIKSFFKKDRKIKPDRSELSTQNV
jgi:hypothetical protein